MPRPTLTPIPRAPGVSRRAVALAMAGRFADELLGGLPDVLMPTIRRELGLGLAQIGLLSLVLNAVAGFVEPANGLLIDLWRRRLLLAWGAAGTGLALVLIGFAPGFPMLLGGYAVYGLASGPLAHTADAVLVEAHPQAPDRIYARATAVDTLGALLAPLSAGLWIWTGADWRWLVIAAGGSGLVYAGAILRTRFPAPPGAPAGRRLRAELRENLRAVLTSRRALAWLAVLFALDLLEAPDPLHTVWLVEAAGMSQGLVALYRAFELVVHLVSLVYLERWLAHAPPRRVLGAAVPSLLLLYPAWLLVPGVMARFALALPLNFFQAMLWPIAKSQSLASVPGRPGTVVAVNALFGFAPLTLTVGLLAEATSLTSAFMLFHVGAVVALLALARLLPGEATR